jgi:uncharacterized protein (TIGR02145 family)
MKMTFRITFEIKMLILVIFLYPSCKKDKPVTLNPIIFNPDLAYETMTDYDGNIYKTITIGTQTWMAENLKTTKYNDGTDIPLITNDTAWSNITTPAYSWYDNNSTYYKPIYGALYNAYTINTGRLCPLGWSVPNNNDWTTLVTFLGDTAGTYPYSARAGNKLREIDIYHWTIGMDGGAGVWYPSTNVGTNESGFTALPCGRRGGDGSFGWSGSETYWWSSSVFSDSTYSLHDLIGNNWNWNVGNVFGGVSRNFDFSKNHGFSVRCLKIN